MTDDRSDLAEIRGQLAAIDLDPASAERMAHQVRGQVGRPPSPRRFVEPILIAAFTSSIVVWAVIEVLAAFR